MTTFVINIVAKSNLAEVLAKDDLALQTNTANLAENSTALSANSLASGATVSSSKKKKKQIEAEAWTWAWLTQKVKQAGKSFLGLDDAQNKVGYNLWGFSFRVGQWFVPAMMVMATSMLPVIAGLLTMATAAILAGGALAGVFALGAFMQMRKTGRNGFQGYGGARRPYEQNSGGYARLSTIFEPIWKVLESPKLKNQMENATWFFKATIGSFAEGLSQMLQNIDPSMLKILENMFINWLPRGMAGLARWGNQIVKSIGVGTLTRINKLIGYFADGIKGIALWLEKGGGWEQLDSLAAIGADAGSTLMDLGKSALPAFSAALSTIYPFPLKPMLETTTNFFNALKSNKDLTDALVTILQVIISIIAMKFVLTILVSAASSFVAKALLMVLALELVWFCFKYYAYAIPNLVESMFNYIMGTIMKIYMKLIDFLTGSDKNADAIAELEKRSLKDALEGQYGWGWAREGALATEAEGERIGQAVKAAGQSLDIFMHTDDGRKEKFAIDSIGEKTGTFRTPATNFRSRQTVRL